MNESVLFEVKESHLETGLRGVPVGYCTTSFVDPQKGLFYGSLSAKEVALLPPEEAIAFLYFGEKGHEASFAQELDQRRSLSFKVKEAICALPREGHPMQLLSCALLIQAMLAGKNDYQEDALSLIANRQELVATVINHHAGWGDTSLGCDLATLLHLPDANCSKLKGVLDCFDVLHLDHGGGNLSAFVGKAVASGLEDLYGSIASAMNALAGPRHGAANQSALSLVEEVHANAQTADEVEAYLRGKLERKELLYGFGHAVLRVEDPRATLFYEIAQKDYPNHPLVKTALLMRERGVKVLKENPKVTNPYPNVDAISGTLLTAAGFPHSEYYTCLFGLSRLVGITIQILYERLWAREGKGTPIVRPKYIYKKFIY